MKNGLLLIPVIALALAACDHRDTKSIDRTQSSLYDDADTSRNYADETRTFRFDSDNTRNNVRDRNFDTLTSGDQSESPDDIVITKKVRRLIIDNGQLSNNAKNVKIITVDGYVTLRGVVNNPQEKTFVERAIKNIQGVKGVDNQLDITTSSSYR